MSPVRLCQPLFDALVQDLREVELRREPAADAVVGAEVALGLEGERGGSIPLKGGSFLIGKVILNSTFFYFLNVGLISLEFYLAINEEILAELVSTANALFQSKVSPLLLIFFFRMKIS